MKSREEWLADRMTGIGGSDAPAVLGLSKWKTPVALYLEKRGEVIREFDEEYAPAKWGRLLEPAIRQEYAERTGQVVRLIPNEIIRHPKHKFIFATPDGITDSGRLYEGKMARTAEGWGEPGSDEIPEIYMVQVQHTLIATRLEVADVAVLIGGFDFRLYEVPAHEGLQNDIVEAEAEFWTGVQLGQPPQLRTAAEAMMLFRKAQSGRTVTAPEGIQESIHNLMRMKIAAAELEAMADAQKALVMGFMGDAETVVDLQGKPLVTWKQAKGASRFNAARFKADSPDLHAQYVDEGEPTRRFLLK